MASPRETPPKKRWPASTNSFDEYWFSGGVWVGWPMLPVGRVSGGGAVWAKLGAAPKASSRATMAGRKVAVMAEVIGVFPLNPLLTRFRLTLGKIKPNHPTFSQNYDRSTAETEARERKAIVRLLDRARRVPAGAVH